MSNQLYRLIERQIDLSRFESSVRNELLNKLQTLHKMVIGETSGYDLDNIKKRQLDRLLRDIKAHSERVYVDIAKELARHTDTLVANEAVFVGDLLKTTVKQPVVTPFIVGLTIEEWMRKQTTDYVLALKRAVRNGDELGLVAKQFKNRLATLSRTWEPSIVNRTRIAATKNNAAVKGYWHVSVLDSKTSDICLVRNNKRWTKDKSPIGHNLEWKEPPLHANCRSFLGFVTDVSEEPAGQTVDDWLDSKTDSELDRILGAHRTELYRSGAITLRDLLDQSGRPRWLP